MAYERKYPDSVVQEKIHGITYTSTKVPCTEALRMLSRATLMLGEDGLRILLAVFAKGVPAGRMLSALGPTAFVRFASNLQTDDTFPRDLMESVKASRLLPGTDSGDVAPRFDTHFRGELPHLFAVCSFVLTHNLMGFTLGSLSMIGSLMSEPAETPPAASSDSETPSEE